MPSSDDLLRELIGEVRALREDQHRARLMMARALAFQISMAKPLAKDQADFIERQLMQLDEPG